MPEEMWLTEALFHKDSLGLGLPFVPSSWVGVDCPWLKTHCHFLPGSAWQRAGAEQIRVDR